MVLLVAVLILTLAPGDGRPVAAPDFSGQWALETPPAGPREGGGGRAGVPGLVGGRGDMGSGWGSPITITQDASRLTVQYAFFGRGDLQPPLTFVYALDGTETKNSVMMGRGIQVQSSRTAWDGGKLLITTVHTFADPASGKPATVEVKQVLSLESPSALVVETTRAGVMSGPPSSVKTTYRKL